MKNMRELITFCAAILLVSSVAGCSISNSIESSSDSFSNSSGSVSDSSSSSSGDDENDKDDEDSQGAPADTSYRDDVADYTSAYVAGLKSAAGTASATVDAAEAVASLQTVPGLDLSAFRKGISEVAAEYGITNWEGDSQTYAGIGAGLAKAGVTAEELPAYSQALAGGDAAKAAGIEKGYGAGS